MHINLFIKRLPFISFGNSVFLPWRSNHRWGYPDNKERNDATLSFSWHTRRHSLKQNLQISLVFCIFYATDPTINKMQFNTSRHQYSSLQTPCTSTSRSKVFSAMPYILTPPLVPFTQSFHCSLSMQTTFISLSCSDVAMYAFLTTSKHLVQGLFLSILPSSSGSYTLSVYHSPFLVS